LKIFKFILILFVLIYSIIAFFPKEKGLNYVNNRLNKQKIMIDYKNFSDNLLGFEILGIRPYYEDLDVGEIEKVKFNIFLFDNKIILNNFIVSDNFKDFIPNIKKVFIKYNILNPKKIFIKVRFIGGKIDGFIDIVNKKVLLKLDAKSSFKNRYKLFIQNFKKNKKGLVFEYNF